MQPLDLPKNYHQSDEHDVYDSIRQFGRQFESGWTAAHFSSLDFDLGKIKNICFCGMGGSNLSAYIAQSLSPFLLQLPFEIIANFRLPAYADKNTLVILSSYSGDTEEVLSCAQDAQMRSCPTVAITSGGKLKALAEEKRFPLIHLDEKYNPSHLPRIGLGLALGATLGFLTRLNPLSTKFFDSKNLAHTLDRVIDMVNREKPTSENPAKTLAMKHRGQGIILLTANHLAGVGKSAANSFNETAKTFSVNFSFPDLNHHLLEGFTFPLSLKENISILILNSSLYPEAVHTKLLGTRDILLQQKYRVTVIKPETATAPEQAFESLVFLILFSYYLGIANKVDPGKTPWVDSLKKKTSP